MLAVYIHVHTAFLALASGQPSTLSTSITRRLRRDERGQTSAEYALVLLGAAAIALLLVAWATPSEQPLLSPSTRSHGAVWATKSDLIGKLFDAVLNAITGKVK